MALDIQRPYRLTNRFNEDKPAPEEAKSRFRCYAGAGGRLGTEKLCLLDETVYLHVQASESGYDYTLYDKKSMKPLVGGCLTARKCLFPPLAC